MNISSGLGSFWAVTSPERDQFRYATIVYSATKAAVSILTVEYAKAVPEIKFNAVEPGFTATDFNNGHDGGQSVEEGAEVIVRLATIGMGAPPAPSTNWKVNSPGKSGRLQTRSG